MIDTFAIILAVLSTVLRTILSLRTLIDAPVPLLLMLILIYVTAVGIGGWCLLRAEQRQRRHERLRSGVLNLVRRLREGINQAWRQTALASLNTLTFGERIRQRLLQHKRGALVTLAVLASAIVLPLIFSTNRSLEGYGDQIATSDPVVTALLHGEQLVAPPPLPPQLFATREVEAVRQELASASREWMVLDRDFRQRLLTVYQLMHQRGYQMVLLEGYRSPERQALLAGLGTHVTNAKAYQSYHQFGLAADSAFLRAGKLVISERDPWAMEGYRLYGELAESVGLVWGGHWRMMDFGHVELRKPNVLVRQ